MHAYRKDTLDRRACLPGRSDPVARNLIGSEQECKSPEDIAHFGRCQDAETVTQSGPVDRSDLGDVYDARTRKSCFTLP